MNELKEISERLSALEVAVYRKKRPSFPEYMTISEYASRQNVSLSRGEKIRLAKKAVDYCDVYGYKIDSVIHTNVVNAYPVEILNKIF